MTQCKEFPVNSMIFLIVIVVSLSTFIVTIPIIYGLILPIFKPSLNKKTTTYLYSFSAGFFMILSTVGFLAEAKEQINEHLEQKNFGIRGLFISLIVGSIVLFALCLALIVKYFSIKKIDGKNNIHIGADHDHDHIIFNNSDYNPKSKRLALFLLLSHRVPGGLILGLLSVSIASNNGQINSENIIFLIAFAVHIIPEELILYYRQIEMGIKRWKAVKNSILATMTLIPFIVLGATVGSLVDKTNKVFFEYVMIIIQLFAASFLLFTAVIEFFPEFLHHKLSGKEWYKIILWFILGVVFALIILSFHSHSFHTY